MFRFVIIGTLFLICSCGGVMHASRMIAAVRPIVINKNMRKCSYKNKSRLIIHNMVKCNYTNFLFGNQCPNINNNYSYFQQNVTSKWDLWDYHNQYCQPPTMAQLIYQYLINIISLFIFFGGICFIPVLICCG